MSFLHKNILYIAWGQALLATLSSLYFSEIVGLPPCILCWYQRIAMYPIVIILTIGIVRKDKNISSYVLPFSIIGGLIAIYHNLLYYGLIPESITPCMQGISCTTRQIEWFGFITIPLLSLLAFIVITICMAVFKKYNQENI